MGSVEVWMGGKRIEDCTPEQRHKLAQRIFDMKVAYLLPIVEREVDAELRARAAAKEEANRVGING